MKPPAAPPFAVRFEDEIYLAFKYDLYNYRIRRKEIQGYLKKTETCGWQIELGAGIAPMLENHPYTVGVDRSEQALKVLKRQNRLRYLVVADLAQLPFRANVFSQLVCSEVLEHIRDDRTAIQEIGRIAAPRATLVVTVPVNPNWYSWDDRWVRHYRRYKAAELIESFRKTGFVLLGQKKILGILDKLACLVFTGLDAWKRRVFKGEAAPQKTPHPMFVRFSITIFRIVNRMWELLCMLENRCLPRQAVAVELFYFQKDTINTTHVESS